jgi:protocatechuate 3,4-dioxygenase beta subunit
MNPMKIRTNKPWMIAFYIVLAVFLTACSAPAPAATTVATVQEVSVQPTQTNISPTKTQVPQPFTTNTEQAPTQTALPPTLTEPAPTETGTSTPEPTPISCDGILTPAQQEGPFFSPGSPQRSSLIDEGMPGVPALIFGRVFDQDCNPIPGAKLDFWLADVNGEYDNVGYTLRGHVFSNEAGYYQIESIEPTSYTGRPPHIHVKVYAPTGEELLTTQMYFAGSENSAEVTNNPELYVTYLDVDQDGRLQVLFNFIFRQ